jgi:N-acetylglutamate synthase
MPALGRLFVTPADLGRKVSIRYLDHSQLTDALGQLVDWKPGWFFVKNKRDELIKIPISQIVASKVVAPEASAGWVLSMALRVWRASEVESLGDWTLQATGGGTARVNSCLIVGLANIPVANALQKVVSWYQAKNLDPLVHLPAPGVFDEDLKNFGFTKTYLIDFLSKENVSSSIALDFLVEDSLSNAWFEAVNRNNGEGRKVDAITLESGEVTKFISLISNDEIIATARLAVVENFALVTNLWVSQSHRQKSIASEIMKLIENLALEIGVKRTWLQVLNTNRAAQNLYQKIGYQKHHQYQYWAFKSERD